MFGLILPVQMIPVWLLAGQYTQKYPKVSQEYPKSITKVSHKYSKSITIAYQKYSKRT